MFEISQSQKHRKPKHQSTAALTWIQDGINQNLVEESFGGGEKKKRFDSQFQRAP